MILTQAQLLKVSTSNWLSQRYSPFSAMWHELFIGFYVKLSWIWTGVVNILQLQCSDIANF
jgi:hypothetical protein